MCRSGQHRRDFGAELPSTAVYIGRPSKWGNPFVIGLAGDRAAVIEKYRVWLWQQKDLLAQLPELDEKDLVCHCAPLACHGDVLMRAYEWFCRLDHLQVMKLRRDGEALAARKGLPQPNFNFYSTSF
jgi:hypothetical protein